MPKTLRALPKAENPVSGKSPRGRGKKDSAGWRAAWLIVPSPSTSKTEMTASSHHKAVLHQDKQRVCTPQSEEPVEPLHAAIVAGPPVKGVSIRCPPCTISLIMRGPGSQGSAFLSRWCPSGPLVGHKMSLTNKMFQKPMRRAIQP